jgi:hypothetical protein
MTSRFTFLCVIDYKPGGGEVYKFSMPNGFNVGKICTDFCIHNQENSSGLTML